MAPRLPCYIRYFFCAAAAVVFWRQQDAILSEAACNRYRLSSSPTTHTRIFTQKYSHSTQLSALLLSYPNSGICLLFGPSAFRLKTVENHSKSTSFGSLRLCAYSHPFELHFEQHFCNTSSNIVLTRRIQSLKSFRSARNVLRIVEQPVCVFVFWSEQRVALTLDHLWPIKNHKEKKVFPQLIAIIERSQAVSNYKHLGLFRGTHL